MYVYRSAKTGKLVTEKFALNHPDTTIRERVKEEKVEAPKAEPKVVSRAEVVQIAIGQIVMFSQGEDEFLGELVSYEPLEVVEHTILNGCHVTFPIAITSLKGWKITPLSKAEIVERLY